MSVREAEELAVKYNLVFFLQKHFTPSFIKKITVRLKGFRPRESSKETPKQWFDNFKSSIPVFSELYDIFLKVVKEIRKEFPLTKQEALIGLIGAFRIIQKREGFNPNLNGYKFGGIQTLLR